MARNVEIKARVAEPEVLEAQVAALADAGPWVIEQDDTFFGCGAGRLKLRDFLTEPASGELIYYSRADTTGPAGSYYERSATSDPAGLRAVLFTAYGQIGRVLKTRRLYMIGRTRVHLDAVAGLGAFMELEVVLADSEAEEAGEAEARRLMAGLGIENSALCEGAYVDMLRA